jgi:aspartyl-tRNA(Asn)/glutamyl-tRNA(Gln) amidotransferase subunit A
MDAALMLTVLSLPDARDWYALPFDDRDYRDDLDAGVKGLRIGLSIDLEHATVDAEVAAAVRAAADVLSALGATVEERSPSLGEAKAVFDAHWYSGAALMLDAVDARKHDLIDPGLREIAAQGAAIPHLDYLEAARTREQLGATMCDYHRSFDALLTPTLPITAFAAGQEVADPSRQRRWVDWTPFTYPFNLTQQPAASIPCGLSSDGLPIGLQIVGPMHRDDVVLRIARAYETASPIKLPSLSNIRGPAPASRDSGQPH